jgi:ferrochelatase
MEYRDLAVRLGVPGYVRLPTPNVAPDFIDALAHLVRAVLDSGLGSCSYAGGRACPNRHVSCPLRQVVPA